MADTIHRATDNSAPLTVYDGQTMLGRIVHRGNSFESFDINGVSYGVFAAMKTAAFSLPAKETTP
jgi:hypothetical protein